MPWRGPDYPGELPTLGWYALDWMAEHLVVPDGPTAGQPLMLTQEQAQFILDFYALDPKHRGPAVQRGALRNTRTVIRAILSRPKGWGKSPILAALCLLEALGDVVPDGWDADGEPVGRPWRTLGFKPKVQVVATSEAQTINTWDPLLEMARSPSLRADYDIEPLDSFINVPRGRIEPTTSNSTSREGFRAVFAVFDQTESWLGSNGGHKLAAAIRRNLTKTGGASVEAPNAFVPGMQSVAELSYEAWKMQQEGRLRAAAGRILLDHREAPPDTDPSERRSLLAGLKVAYGDSVWVDLNRVVQDFWDPASDPQDSRRFFLNQITHASDAWLSAPEWHGCRADEDVAPVSFDDPVVLGFDGSRRRSHAVTDATALIGCRVSDGHLFQIRVWEQPENDPDWRVPVGEVDAEVREAHERYQVVGMYADPAKWESYVARWEADFSDAYQVRVTRDHPIEWWFTGGRAHAIVRATDQLHNAILDRELTHCGSAALTRHMLNARRRHSQAGVQIHKDHPESPRKIDAAVASILAWQARLDALSAGVDDDADAAANIW